MMKKSMAIIGAGEMGLQAKHYAEVSGEYDVVGFFDDTLAKGTVVDNVPLLGAISDVSECYEQKQFEVLFIGIGYKYLRFKQELYEQLCKIIPFATIIASPTYVDSTAEIGKNCILYPGCIVDKNVIIGDGCVVNLGATISHDVTVGNSCFLAPQSTIAGFSHVGNYVFCGVNSTVIDNINITSSATIGAGALVNKDITDSGVYIGAPIRRLK